MSKNHLLLIGMNNYLFQDHLNCCVKDCNDLRDLLFEKYDFEDSTTIELYNDEATNLNIQNRMVHYAKELTKDNNLIIYYSGHGGYDKRSESGFWIPYDAKKDDFTTWIPNEVILSYISRINAKHIFLISDSCFSRTILMAPGKSIFADAKDYDHFQSRWALTSGAEECKDGDPGENSFFGETLLNGLRDSKENMRVSKLIEIVKEQFSTNLFQKPQGYPLNDRSHRGGEFIFKIIREDISSGVKLKGYKNYDKILKQYKRSTHFKETARIENKEKKIGFQIFQEYDSVLKKASYFLFLYEGINTKNTSNYIRANHPELFKEKWLVIIIPKEKNQINPEIRKNNIKNVFQPLNIYYLDEFIYEQCTPKRESDVAEGRYLDIPNFVVPTFSFNDQQIEDTKIFTDWLINENEPILVLKGTGGIGKTTLAQFIADKFIKHRSNSSVIFIDSSEIRAELIKRESNYENISIYDFYEALFALNKSDTEKWNEDVFQLNLDAGNFLLVIDGLDEVISKVPKFNVDEFLNSIIEYTSDIGNGKVIVTCRSYFWEASKYSSEQIKTIEILPFNEKQTLRFFNKSFGEDNNKKNKARILANGFRFLDDQNEYHFHPYVLDVIRSIVESEQKVIEIDTTFSSSILEKTVKNDYIIFQICNREKIRVDQIDIDEQLLFFLYLAIKRRGILNIENFSRELSEALNKHIDKTTVDAFKSHPFIQTTKKTIQFRYDFFADYFKSIFISNHLSLDSRYDKISPEFIKIVVENCWYGSSMISDIKNRVVTWGENEILKCYDLITQIITEPSISVSERRKCISGIFNTCLAINFKFRSNDSRQNTNLMKGLFGKGEKQIIAMHIINMHSNPDRVRFDFSGMHLIDCFVDNYQAFWDCTFDNETIFENSYLLNLEFDSGKKIKILKENFRNCTIDSKFNAAFYHENQTAENRHQQIKEFIRDFFGLFLSRGLLQSQTINKAHKGREHHPSLNIKYAKMSNQIFDFDELLAILKKEDFLNFFNKFTEDKVEITPARKNELIKFMKDGLMSKSIAELITKLSEIPRNLQ